MTSLSANYGNHFGRVCASLLLKQIEMIFAEEPRLLDESDPEPLHEMRVSANRMRICLRFLPGFAGRGPKKKLLRECRHYARLLGSARDFDVAQGHIEDAGRPANPRLQAGYDWVLESFAADKAERRMQLRQETEQPRYAEFKALLSATAGSCQNYLEQTAAENGTIPVKQQLSQQLPKIFGRLVEDFFDYRAELAGCFSSEEVHQLRKLGKRLRYLVNFFAEYRPATFGALRKTLKELHDTTGELHDIDVLLPYLEAKFAVLAARDAPRGRAVRPGFNWLTRKLYNKRQLLMRRFTRLWSVIHSTRFHKQCAVISRPWRYRAKTGEQAEARS